MKNRKQSILIWFLFLLFIITSSWGFLVHKTLHQLAVYQLPKGMQSLFYTNMDYLIKNAPRPDTRRNTDTTEATKHFIDIEAFGENAINTMPTEWQNAIAKYSEDTLKKYGYVPYVIIDLKNKLTNAFVQGNKDSILFYAADIGHYIGDANVPLHTSLNYDGQLTNQKGLHSLWESMIPEIEIEQYNLYSNHKATYLEKPEASIWQSIQRANALLPDLFAKEIEVSKKFSETEKYRIQMRRGKEVKYYTTAFAKAYNIALGNTINEQLIHSANLIADIWFTSWVDAGKPNLENITKEPFSRGLKKQLRIEKRSFSNNNLLKDKLLKAKEEKRETE